MIQNMKLILEKAKNGKYAVPHFNISNLEWARFILEECQSNNSPVILGVSEGAAKYMGGYFTVMSIVKGLVRDLNITIPVAVHLDHGSCFEACKNAIDAGFPSVMIDASRFEIEENIKITKEVVDYAQSYNVSVEAEVGHIGGTEENITAEIQYATVEDAIKLVQETKIDFLAPALGSVHGLYKGEPHINFARMKEIKEAINLPLVLHGGTGLSDEIIKEGINCGICKLNIDTELRIAWTTGVRKFLEENEKVYDPRKIIKSGEVNIKEAVRYKIQLLGSNNKA